jgi:hypothetical protein
VPWCPVLSAPDSFVAASSPPDGEPFPFPLGASLGTDDRHLGWAAVETADHTTRTHVLEPNRTTCSLLREEGESHPLGQLSCIVLSICIYLVSSLPR